jgi:hypothetical protein
VITFLRLAGLGTAAVWLGGTVFFVVGLDPLFGRPEVVRLLGPLHLGEVGLLAAGRFHLFQVICASLALIHALAEWLYSGKPLDRRVVFLLTVMLVLGSVGRLYLTPKCRALNAQAYLGPQRQIMRQAFTPSQREAERSLGVWQGVGMIFNVISTAGAVLYFAHQASPNQGGPRVYPRVRLRI